MGGGGGGGSGQEVFKLSPNLNSLLHLTFERIIYNFLVLNFTI